MTAINRWWRARRDRSRWIAEALVTAALTEQSELCGGPLWQRTGLSSGRMYVALVRMEADGRVASRWVASSRLDGPYPRRRAYRLLPSANRLTADNTRLRDALTALLAQHDQPGSWADRELAVEQARQVLAGRQDGDGRD